LIISDLHLGSPARISVLAQNEALERLVDQVRRSDRLVLLGDVVELLEGRAQLALARSNRVLGALGAAVGKGGEVILVPGNHDRPLIRGWLRGRGRDLGVDERVPVEASPALASVVAQLGTASVQVRYPGAQLSDSVWVTHGHYLDRHLVPVSNWGRLRGTRGQVPQDRVEPWQYERPGRVHLSPALGWLPGPAAARLGDLATLVRATTMPAIQEGVLDPRIAPLTARMLSLQMRRHALPAMGRVVDRLGVQADWVVFGHVHRLGPLPGDDADQWRDPTGRIELLNAGSWLWEPRLVNRVQPPHPYWPGGSVLLEDGAQPRAVGLLDDLTAEQLSAAPGV
jgi:predicted phosphodiesterase